MRTALAAVVGFACCASLAFGCSRLLGFERASLDPESVPALSPLQGDAGGTLPVQASDHSMAHTSDAGMPDDEAVEALDAAADTTSAATNDATAAGDAAQARDASAEQDAAATTAPEALPLDCETFCGVVADACPRAEAESYAVYDSTFTCLRQCEGYALGTQGEDSGNTLACRMTHALIARDFPGERASSCPAAGPGGNGVCGSNCEGYCSLMLRTCDVFADARECLDACADVPDLGGFEVSQNEGNSVQCRLYHLGAALASPTFHCPHASGQSPCAESESVILPLP